MLPQRAVATSSNLQKHSVIRQLTQNLQLRKPRHPKRPQLPPGAVYIQIEQYLNQLLFEQARELNKIVNIVHQTFNRVTTPSKLTKFKASYHYVSQIQTLKIRIPPNICSNCFHCYPQRCSHLPKHYSSISFLSKNPFIPRANRH